MLSITRVTITLFCCFQLTAQVAAVYNPFPRDFSASFKPVITGDHTTVKCTAGVSPILFDSPTYYGCTATDTWSAFSSGSATGTVTSVVIAGTANKITAGGTCTITTTGTCTLTIPSGVVLVAPVLGTPASGDASNLINLPISTGVSGLATGIATFLATSTSANLAAAVTNETGSGALVFATSPTLVTPILGTPTSGNASNLTNLPITLTTTGTSGASTWTQATNTLNIPQYTAGGGTGCVPSGTIGQVLVDSGSGTCTSTGVTIDSTAGRAGGIQMPQGTLATPAANSIIFTAPTSVTTAYSVAMPSADSTGFWLETDTSNAGVVTFVASTGTGNVVRATSPTLVTPLLGTPTSGVATNLTGLPLTTGVIGILPVANGGTGTASTLTGLVRGSGSAMTAAELSGDATTSGSNVVTVAKVNGVSSAATPSNHTVQVVTASNTRTDKVVPDCTDTAGNHINFTQSSDAFSCGTSSPQVSPTAGTSVSLSSGISQMFVCTSTCTITVPVPAAGAQYCVYNDDNVTTVITMSAIGSSARYENTARTAYGTAGTGTFVSSGAAGDRACLIYRDSTHYTTIGFNGTWTAN